MTERLAAEQAARERDIGRAVAMELAASEARQRAILDAALDGVISIDSDARISYLNAAAERIFGYRAENMIGQELAEAIVPPSLREAHRAGFARYLATGEPRILDRRIEIIAMRADGSEFPAELTITRTGPPEAPAFTGYVRDITDRQRAERELVAARERFKLVADEQAALRRVATLVAEGAEPRIVFDAVCETTGLLLGAASVNLAHFPSDGTNLTVAGWSLHGTHVPPGTRLPLEGHSISHLVKRTEAPGRVDSYEGLPGPLAARLRELGIKSEIGAPVVVSGSVWGALIAGADNAEPLPKGAELRIASFAELVATAISNATAHTELNDSQLMVQARLSLFNAVFALSLILIQASSPHQVIRLVTTAVPSIAPCDKALAWHPSRSGDYYERAPDSISDALANLTVPSRLEMGDSFSWWAFPLTSPPARNPIFLVIAGAEPLSNEEAFLLPILAQLCGTVITKLELTAAERANAQRVATLNAELESTVSTLTKIMETHRRLNEIAANAGEMGIAETLYQLTKFPVLIQDVYGNTRAAAGEVPDDHRAKEQPQQRQELIRQLRIAHRAVYHRRAWLVLASPRSGVIGVIALMDPARTASETDLAALEYAGTVLSVELARLQSVAEAELRSQRDFAEELLAGADESMVKASSHVLGYDPQRPHRVIIATGRPRDGLGEQFFQSVVREVRRLDVGTLVVARTDYVVIVAYREADWAKLQAAITGDLPRGACRLAGGSRYPNAWRVGASYREAQFVANLTSPALSNLAGPVLLFESLGVYRMLSAVTDPAGIEEFMNEQLGALIEYDKQHHSSLLLTLARYFDSSCNYDQAAAALSIHRSTLKYRMKRIRELLGRDPHDGSTRLDLHLATKVWLTLESLRRTEQA